MEKTEKIIHLENEIMELNLLIEEMLKWSKESMSIEEIEKRVDARLAVIAIISKF